MDICYVCEKPFLPAVEPESDNEGRKTSANGERTPFDCKQHDEATHVPRHGEHIIPNAIGGKLISQEFLCECCGNDLGGKIDAPLYEHLRIFALLHGISRDRGEASRAAIQVTSRIEPKGVFGKLAFSIHSDFSVTPNMPIFFQDDDARTITICGPNTKTANVFAKSPTIAQLRADGYAIVTEENLAQFVHRMAFRVDFDHIEVLQGVAKIAIGYALYCDIPYNCLKDFAQHCIRTRSAQQLRATISQYYPMTDEEKLYETGKFKHEDWYPNHQLYLFSIDQHLYCFVELFGVLQKYVHLSSTFSGNQVPKKYLQRVTKWDHFDNCDGSRWSPKDVHILAGQYGVDLTGLSHLEASKKVLQAAKSKPYEIDPDTQLEKVKALLETLITFVITGIKEHKAVDEMLDKAELAKSQFGFQLVEQLRINKLFAMQLMQKNYADFRIKAGTDSCPDHVAKVPEQTLRNYVAYRLYDTLCSVGKENDIQCQLI